MTEFRQFRGNSSVWMCAVERDGETLVSMHQRQCHVALRIRDEDGRPDIQTYEFNPGHGRVCDACFSACGRRFARVTANTTVHIYDLSGGSFFTMKEHQIPANKLCNGRVGCVALHPKNIDLFAVSTPKAVFFFEIGKSKGVYVPISEAVDVAFSPDGDEMSVVTANGTIKFYDSSLLVSEKVPPKEKHSITLPIGARHVEWHPTVQGRVCVYGSQGYAFSPDHRVCGFECFNSNGSVVARWRGNQADELATTVQLQFSSAKVWDVSNMCFAKSAFTLPIKELQINNFCWINSGSILAFATNRRVYILDNSRVESPSDNYAPCTVLFDCQNRLVKTHTPIDRVTKVPVSCETDSAAQKSLLVVEDSARTNPDQSKVFVKLANMSRIIPAPGETVWDVCEYNAKVCEELGCVEYAQLWRLSVLAYMPKKKDEASPKKESAKNIYFSSIFFSAADRVETGTHVAENMYVPSFNDEIAFLRNESVCPMDQFTAFEFEKICKTDITKTTAKTTAIKDQNEIFKRTVEDMLIAQATSGKIQIFALIFFVLKDDLMARPQINNTKCARFIYFYLRLLHRVGLYLKVEELLSICPEFHDEKLHLYNCEKLRYLSSGNTTVKIAKKSGLMQTTRPRGFMCSICHQPVRGLAAWCTGCGHGGHITHMNEWFKEHQMCPAGCSHMCHFNPESTKKSKQ